MIVTRAVRCAPPTGAGRPPAGHCPVGGVGPRERRGPVARRPVATHPRDGEGPGLERGRVMGLLSRLFGRDRGQRSPYGPGYTDPSGDRGYGYAQQPPRAARPAGQTEDERAIERYRYLLRTAPPDQVEAA